MSQMPRGLSADSDGVIRCAWPGKHLDYRDYHDQEWGYPKVEDTQLFEKICLEGFQSGLSWLTILRKRESFRRAFRDFDIDKIQRFNKRSIDRLLADSSIVRHRGKIEAVIHNAFCAKELLQDFGSLSAFFWQYEPEPESRPTTVDHRTLSALTASEESLAMSKALKRRGWRFVGPTTMYSFMQSVGMVNDHLEGCFVRKKVDDQREALVRP